MVRILPNNLDSPVFKKYMNNKTKVSFDFNAYDFPNSFYIKLTYDATYVKTFQVTYDPTRAKTSYSEDGEYVSFSVEYISLEDNEIRMNLQISNFFNDVIWVGNNRVLKIELYDSDNETLMFRTSTLVSEEKSSLLESVTYANNELSTYLANKGVETHSYDGLSTTINRVNGLRYHFLILNPNNYNAHNDDPTIQKNMVLSEGNLKNYSVGKVSMNTEFIKASYYNLYFDYYTSQGTRNGFMFGYDPTISDGELLTTSSMDNDVMDKGINIITDVGNTVINSWHDGNTEQLRELNVNCLTEGTHTIRIVKQNGRTTIFVDNTMVWADNTGHHSTLGLWKWGDGFNSISNIRMYTG